jgi:2-polyprenyl-6-methoxyphenol hydroxylase-like FAD-dependent oxidoreductase
MTKSKTFAIVGGGIGGLTTAIALQKKGIDVKVYENASSFKPLGAGIVLAANAMKALRAIGIEDQVLNAGNVLKRFAIKDTSGSYLTTTEAEKINQKFGLVNTLTLHRADLHNVLLNNISSNVVITGKQCIDFTPRAGEVELRFADGSSTTVNYVIAADGIHSIFRKKLIPSSTFRYAGYTCYRAVIECQEGLMSSEASETWGHGQRFGIVPLKGNRIYWYATFDAPEEESNSFLHSVPDLISKFEDFHSPVPEIISLTKPHQLIKNNIADFKPIKQYAFGNVVLMGDAAHATTPNLGQGACMAIEDSVVLGNCLADTMDVEKSFRLFESLRIARNTQIVNTSYSMGRVAQFRNPILVRLRNAALGIVPAGVAERQLKFLYDISFN